jgi:hypothetical protein
MPYTRYKITNHPEPIPRLSVALETIASPFALTVLLLSLCCISSQIIVK